MCVKPITLIYDFTKNSFENFVKTYSRNVGNCYIYTISVSLSVFFKIRKLRMHHKCLLRCLKYYIERKEKQINYEKYNLNIAFINETYKINEQ